MKSYYEILELVKNGKEPKLLVLKLNCGSRLYKANYDQEEFNYYGLADSNLEDSNFKYYLADTLLESQMFDEIIEVKEVCHKCGEYAAEYNQTYCEFCLGISKNKKKIKKLSYQQIGTYQLDQGLIDLIHTKNKKIQNQKDELNHLYKQRDKFKKNHEYLKQELNKLKKENQQLKLEKAQESHNDSLTIFELNLKVKLMEQEIATLQAVVPKKYRYNIIQIK